MIGRRQQVMCLFTLLMALPNGAGAESQTSSPPATSAAAATITNSLPADPNAAWKEIELALRPPPPPAEWAGRQPTAVQREAFTKTLGEKSAAVAGKAKEFYTRFPEHPKAEEAKYREQQFLQQAISFGNTAALAAASAYLSEQQKLEEKINDAHRRAMAKRAEGSQAVVKELEAGIRALIKEYPDQPVLWEQMLLIARNTIAKEKKKAILVEIVESQMADERTFVLAKAAIKAVGALDQPLEMAFTAADGRKVDIQKMKGKVILVDFWSAGCAPCIIALPEMIKLYNQYHDAGFEIVGINLDKFQFHMESVVHRYKIPWPQYHDGQGFGNKFALEFNVSYVPVVWLVDKKGVLRDVEAQVNMEEKIKELLAEKGPEKD